MTIAAANDRDPWDSIDRDCLLLAIEQTLRVRTAAHFYAWTQGALQCVLPHEVMCCASFDGQGHMLGSQVLCPVLLDSVAREALLGREHGLLHALLRLWKSTGNIPLIIDKAIPPSEGRSAIDALMARLGFENFAAHGALSPSGEVDAFFGFARIGKRLDARLCDLLELVVPHLRSTLIRVRPYMRQAHAFARALTDREGEVLRLLQHGHSNAQIGAELSISPLTVKNHVQKVLRKLGVRNRTQAAAIGKVPAPRPVE